jgi:hypothetical protein
MNGVPFGVYRRYLRYADPCTAKAERPLLVEVSDRGVFRCLVTKQERARRYPVIIARVDTRVVS